MIVFQFEAKLAMYVFLYDGLFVIKLPTLGNFNIYRLRAWVYIWATYGQRQIIDLRATDKSWYFARSRPIIVLLFTYKASLYLPLKLTSFMHKLYFLKNYLITSSSLIFLACKYCRKTLTAVLVAFLYSLSFFPVVNQTTRLLIVQENEAPLFTKSGGNAHAQTIICRWATFLTNAHAQTIICTQLFAGKLTNQNWEYYKVNNNSIDLFSHCFVHCQNKKYWKRENV